MSDVVKRKAICQTEIATSNTIAISVTANCDRRREAIGISRIIKRREKDIRITLTFGIKEIVGETRVPITRDGGEVGGESRTSAVIGVIKPGGGWITIVVSIVIFESDFDPREIGFGPGIVSFVSLASHT